MNIRNAETHFVTNESEKREKTAKIVIRGIKRVNNMLFLLKDENIYRTTVASDADGAAGGTYGITGGQHIAQVLGGVRTDTSVIGRLLLTCEILYRFCGGGVTNEERGETEGAPAPGRSERRDGAQSSLTWTISRQASVMKSEAQRADNGGWGSWEGRLAPPY